MARVAEGLAPLCCDHWVNRISGLQVSLAQFNANAGVCLCAVAREGNRSRIFGLHLVTVLIHTCLCRPDLVDQIAVLKSLLM